MGQKLDINQRYRAAAKTAKLPIQGRNGVVAVCKGAPALCRTASSGKALTWILRLTLGAGLRDTCNLGRGNLRPFMRTIRALNSTYLSEGHNEVASFISETEEGGGRMLVFINVSTLCPWW